MLCLFFFRSDFVEAGLFGRCYRFLHGYVDNVAALVVCREVLAVDEFEDSFYVNISVEVKIRIRRVIESAVGIDELLIGEVGDSFRKSAGLKSVA